MRGQDYRKEDADLGKVGEKAAEEYLRSFPIYSKVEVHYEGYDIDFKCHRSNGKVDMYDAETRGEKDWPLSRSFFPYPTIHVPKRKINKECDHIVIRSDGKRGVIIPRSLVVQYKNTLKSGNTRRGSDSFVDIPEWEIRGYYFDL